jgi:hypothetical protein
MEFSNKENSCRERPDDVSTDHIIAEITERVQRISREEGNTDCIPFSNWLRAEQEIREKYGLPPRSRKNSRENDDAGQSP